MKNPSYKLQLYFLTEDFWKLIPFQAIINLTGWQYKQMKKLIYLVRHGEKVKIIGDPPLTEKGKGQAIITGEFFKGKTVDKIISSPILRTRQTSSYIGNSLNLVPQIDDLLKERVNWGDGPDQSFEDFLAMWSRASKEREWIPPAGDSSTASGNRLKKAIKKIGDDINHVVLVTHGGIITDFLRNEFEEEILNTKFPKFSEILDVAILECSITSIYYYPLEEKFELIELASVKHLDTDLKN